MANKPFYQVAKIHGLDSESYMILETIFTSDGPRTRIKNGRWKSLIAALDEIELLKSRKATPCSVPQT